MRLNRKPLDAESFGLVNLVERAKLQGGQIAE
jgi:hypothetical protein